MTENETPNESIDALFTDPENVEEGVNYIQPDLELKLAKDKREDCRQIVQEIKAYGVTSQRQTLYLIYLLALEIEDAAVLKTIVDACKMGRKELADTKTLIIPT